MPRRPGRRPGKQDTRQLILDAARLAFAEHGYDGTSIRRIAGAAGVDPALIHHYFGTKERLFGETVGPPLDPDVLLPRVFADGIDGVGERLADTFLSIWEDPKTGPAIEAIFRGAFGRGLPARLLREFFTVAVLRRGIAELHGVVDSDDVPLRANLVASQLFGLAAARYVLELEPLASTPRADVVAILAPTIQHYVAGALG